MEVLRDAPIASSRSQATPQRRGFVRVWSMAFPICYGFARASLVIALARDACFLYSSLSERRDHKKNTAVQLALAIFHVGGLGS
jgi:hypothetical protein